MSFRAGDRRRVPTQTNLQDVAGVPLFIKRPGQRDGRIEGGAVRTIDVLPTIARELGLRLPGRVDGVPAGERDSDPGTRIEVPDSFGLGTTGTFGAVLSSASRACATSARCWSRPATTRTRWARGRS